MYKKSAVAMAVCLVAGLGQPVLAGDVTVDGYSKSSDGAVWKSSSGECVRTGKTVSSELLEECGYETVVEKGYAVETTPTATGVTMVEESAVVKDDKVITAAVVVEQVTINNVEFGFDSAELTPEYKAELDAVSEILKPHRQMLRDGLETLHIIGYTDSRGADAYNQKLSERRAQSVANYLIEQDPARASFIKVIGRGEADPIASNDTEEGRRQNRRVVFEVIRK